jgi:N6-adenosine-specific RNA methylase IME4
MPMAMTRYAPRANCGPHLKNKARDFSALIFMLARNLIDETVEVQVLEFHPVANLFPLMVGEPFADLVRDIKENGLREDIWLFEGKILDGRNRYRACLEAGREPRYREWVDDGRGPVAFVVSENLHRRHLNESQRAMVASRLATLPFGANQHAQICAPSQSSAGALLNVSRRSVQDAKVVIERGSTELSAAVDRGGLPVSVAAKLIALPAQEQAAVVEKLATNPRAAINAAREVRRQEHLGAILEATAPALESVGGPFPVICADPPWQHEMRPSDSRNIELNHYPTMPLADICALPVSAIAHRDAVLYLWALPHMLPEAMQVITAWGFALRTHQVWDKGLDEIELELAAINGLMDGTSVEDKTGLFTLGHWLRNRHEDVLIAVRGNMPTPPVNARPPSIIRARRGEHSVKPEIVYQDIEKAYPSLPKLELFARRGRPGWVSWGNQIPVVTAAEDAA